MIWKRCGASQSPGTPRGGRSRRAFPWRMAGGLILLIVAAVVLFVNDGVRPLLRDSLAWIEQVGAWGQVLFVARYVAATVLLIPGSALGLGAGALFGVVRGSALVSFASTLGATCAFLLGRSLIFGSLARAVVETRPRTAAEWALYAVGLVATIAVVAVVTRLARRALAQRTTSAP